MPISPQPRRYRTAREFADMMGFHYHTVLEKLKSGELRGLWIAGQWRIHDKIFRLYETGNFEELNRLEDSFRTGALAPVLQEAQDVARVSFSDEELSEEDFSPTRTSW